MTWLGTSYIGIGQLEVLKFIINCSNKKVPTLDIEFVVFAILLTLLSRKMYFLHRTITNCHSYHRFFILLPESSRISILPFLFAWTFCKFPWSPTDFKARFNSGFAPLKAGLFCRCIFFGSSLSTVQTPFHWQVETLSQNSKSVCNRRWHVVLPLSTSSGRNGGHKHGQILCIIWSVFSCKFDWNSLVMGHHWRLGK